VPFPTLASKRVRMKDLTTEKGITRRQKELQEKRGFYLSCVTVREKRGGGGVMRKISPIISLRRGRGPTICGTVKKSLKERINLCNL